MTSRIKGTLKRQIFGVNVWAYLLLLTSLLLCLSIFLVLAKLKQHYRDKNVEVMRFSPKLELKTSELFLEEYATEIAKHYIINGYGSAPFNSQAVSQIRDEALSLRLGDLVDFGKQDQTPTGYSSLYHLLDHLLLLRRYGDFRLLLNFWGESVYRNRKTDYILYRMQEERFYQYINDRLINESHINFKKGRISRSKWAIDTALTGSNNVSGYGTSSHPIRNKAILLSLLLQEESEVAQNFDQSKKFYDFIFYDFSEYQNFSRSNLNNQSHHLKNLETYLLGVMHFKNLNLEDAINHFKTVLSNKPSEPIQSYSALMYARCLLIAFSDLSEHMEFKENVKNKYVMEAKGLTKRYSTKYNSSDFRVILEALEGYGDWK